VKALSLRQPWAHAVLHGGKRIENRVAWTNSSFRGEFLIHAAKGMTCDEYDNAVIWAGLRGLAWANTVPDMKTLERGGIVGIARVVGVVKPDKGTPCGATIESGPRHGYGLTPDEARWWMGAFALVLDDVRATPFVPCKGALGFFAVPDDVARKALGT